MFLSKNLKGLPKVSKALPDFSGRGQVSMEFIITIIMVLMIFLFGVFLFQNRTDFNYQVSQSWEAKDMANKIARNINNVYLMDNNSVLVDYVFWNDSDRMVEIGDRTIRVYYGSNFSDAPFFAELEWKVTDVNGYILFKKINNKLVVDYE